MISLRPYQQEAIQAVRAGFVRGIRRPLISLPTGTGKTVVFSAIVEGAVKKGRRVLILAHRDELLQQASDKLTTVAPDLWNEIGFVKAQRNEIDRSVVIASVQTLARQKRLDALVEYGLNVGRPFDLVIVDEAHHSAADSYQRILTGLGCFEDGGPLTIGVTATPQRSDALDLGATWQEVIYHRDMLWAMRSGYLCDLRGIKVTLGGLDLGGVKTTAGDYNTGDLEEALEAADAPEHGVRAWQKYAAGRKTICFTPTIKLAHAVAAAFQAQGVSAAALSGETHALDRKEMLARFAAGDLKVIANAQVLTEGFDEPGVECIMIARPTKSQPMYVQMVGRGTRLSPGKKDCVILDIVGATDRLDLTTLPKLFGLGEDDSQSGDPEKDTGSVLGAADHHDEVERKAGRISAREVELFARQDFAWVPVRPGLWVLGTGPEGDVELVASGETWTAQVRKKGAGTRILLEGVDLGYAMGAGDDYARSSGDRAAYLVAKDAPWRSRTATTKQLDTLRKLKVATPHGLSAGEASDLLAAAIASKAKR